MDCATQLAGTWPRTLGPIEGTHAQRRHLGAENRQVELVRRAQAGDLQAYEELFNQYHRGIFNLIYQMLQNDADAADLTQDVFVRVWKALPRLQAPEAFPSWLYRVATNLTRNWIRDHGRFRPESLDQPANEDEESSQRDIADCSADPAALTQTRAMQEAVQRAIRTLSPDHRMVVTLHHLEGRPVEEIARIMNCSVGTVKSRLSRARDHLRRKLAGFVEG